MKKEDREIFLKQIFWEVVGSAFIAGGIYNFAVQAGFPMTGFSGISIILYQLFGVAILCYRLLGRHFFFSSLRCMLISSLMIDYVAPLLPVYSGDRLLAALCTGVFAGLGYAVIYMQNSSTGGSDFIIMAVKNLKPYWSVGKISFVTDVIIILLGGFLLRDVDGIIYGMIVSFLLAIVVDKLMYGINSGKMTLVVTEHGKEICDVIDSCCGRGSTILQGQGGYRCDDKQVVMCVCNNKEMYLLQHAVKEADPASFMIILESNEVHGEGFRTIRIGEGETQAKNSAV